MAQFQLKDSTRALMATEHRAVQTAISIIANQHFGYTDLAGGVGLYQGGVLVNGCDITLRANDANDEARRKPKNDSPEELAAVVAIGKVAKIIEQQGIHIIKSYEKPGHWMSDPLRTMLNVR